MRLDSITRIERYMQDVLLSSTQIPLGVNVLRLAATEETEGVVQQGRTIVVRYLSSSLNVQNIVPLTTLRTLTFEVTLSAQSYLADSGHDYVVQMCAGSYNALTGAVPVDTGMEVFEPFYLANENFEGLTDESIYVYTQTWQLTVQDVAPLPPIDPCVQRGNCSALFPACVVSVIGPAEVVPAGTNKIYSPVLPPPATSLNYDPRLCGVVEQPGNPANLVYKFNEPTVFIENWADYDYVSTGQLTKGGEDFLIVDIYNRATGSLFRQGVMYSWCDCRRLLSVQVGLYTSPIGKVGNEELSGGPENLPLMNNPKNGLGYVFTTAGKVTVYADPCTPGAPTAQLDYGVPLYYYTGVELTCDGVTYLQVSRTPLGKAWIPNSEFVIVDYDPRKDCDEFQAEISPGIPEGGSYPNVGKLTECDE